MIALYWILLGYEKLDRSDLVVRDFRSTRGHEKVKKGVCRRDIKNSFLQRNTEIWNELQNEIVNAISIHDFKGKTG